ncbi:nudix hydrolase [Thermosipho africanus Ob7]|jgi:ADP-ribose pyrophosphatase|uniref:NUDIX domain-containing protein n=1 Tax=Thermosipho africanus TaxID=2421 RepID=UPI000E0AE22C|nr:NUDIX hydrolase [Thermosipho africanus]MDK2838623.1 ADP-ribose pyrophosphatase [Thermosipho sp. (in: thermotogales)]MDK2900382.1 ADP-ribose pyrophosphatase [Thermosipho sp. (in: thermotogales)]RDI91859.1 nudix hydrolase [Thermosipho africanus Ob7]
MEKKISSKEIFKGLLLHVKKDEVMLENGRKSFREYVLHPGAVAVVPILDDNKVVLVKQFRYPIGKQLLEIPAGKFDFKDEDPLECAKRELKEETGFDAKDYLYLGYIHTTPGFSNEVIHLYLARNLESGQSNPDEDEIIDVEIEDFNTVLQKCISGEITDAKTIAGIFKAYFILRSENNG